MHVMELWNGGNFLFVQGILLLYSILLIKFTLQLSMFQFIELSEIEIIFFFRGGGCYFAGCFTGFS